MQFVNGAARATPPCVRHAGVAHCGQTAIPRNVRENRTPAEMGARSKRRCMSVDIYDGLLVGVTLNVLSNTGFVGFGCVFDVYTRPVILSRRGVERDKI